MDYKKILKSANVREKILNILSFIPDTVMLKIQYRIKTGRRLNLKNPKRFTEKLQWYKINYKDPLMKKCVNKYRVRDYIKERGLENILVPLYGKYNDINEVNWDTLPDRFIMKTTNGGGGLNVFVCSNKEKSSFAEAKVKFVKKYDSIPVKSGGREWVYYGLPYGIVVEKLLINEDNPDEGINDYKIFCYNGKPKYIVVDVDRYTGHRRNFYDTNWINLHISSDCPQADREILKPENLDEMLNVASRLSEAFPFVRVDLYNVNNTIYFGELTFFPWSGYVRFYPDASDFILADDFLFPAIQ